MANKQRVGGERVLVLLILGGVGDIGVVCMISNQLTI